MTKDRIVLSILTFNFEFENLSELIDMSKTGWANLEIWSIVFGNVNTYVPFHFVAKGTIGVLAFLLAYL